MHFFCWHRQCIWDCSAPYTFFGLGNAGSRDECVNIIRDIYTDNMTTYVSTDGLSQPVHVNRGVKQGCPLSWLLFDIVLDYVIRTIPDYENHSILAYADDLLLIAGNPADLQARRDILSWVIQAIGLKLDPAKCFSLHLGLSPMEVKDTTFTVGEHPVTHLLDGDSRKFLGKPLGFNICRNNETLEDTIDVGQKILSSALAPWQRLDALKSFYYPSLQFYLRAGKRQKSCWSNLVKLLTRPLKKCLYLGNTAKTAYLHGDTRKGLFGIPIFAEDSDISFIDGAFKLLTSRDPALREIAWEDLKEFLQDRTREDPTKENVANFLSGMNFRGSNRISAIWTKARVASHRLKITWSFDEEWNPKLTQGNNTIIDRRKIFCTMGQHYRDKEAKYLEASRHQGKTFACFSKSKHPRTFIGIVTSLGSPTGGSFTGHDSLTFQ